MLPFPASPLSDAPLRLRSVASYAAASSKIKVVYLT